MIELDEIKSDDFVLSYTDISDFLSKAQTQTHKDIAKVYSRLNSYLQSGQTVDSDPFMCSLLFIINEYFIKYSDCYHYSFDEERIFNRMLRSDISKILLTASSFGDNNNGFSSVKYGKFLTINTSNPDAFSSTNTDGNSFSRFEQSPLSSGQTIDNASEKSDNNYGNTVTRKFSTIDERDKAIKMLIKDNTFVSYIEGFLHKYIFELNCIY